MVLPYADQEETLQVESFPFLNLIELLDDLGEGVDKRDNLFLSVQDYLHGIYFFSCLRGLFILLERSDEFAVAYEQQF